MVEENSADGCPPPPAASARYWPLANVVIGTVNVNEAVPEPLEVAPPIVLTILPPVVAQ